MPQVRVETYTNGKTIQKFGTAEGDRAMPVMVSDVGVTANAEGRKIVPAGSIVGGGVLRDVNNKQVSVVNDGTAEGILSSDIDVTYGPASADMIVHSIINLSKLPVEPTAEAEAAMKLILFIA